MPVAEGGVKSGCPTRAPGYGSVSKNVERSVLMRTADDMQAPLATPDARALASSLLVMSPEVFDSAYKQTPLSRAKPAGLQRNARSVLENPG